MRTSTGAEVAERTSPTILTPWEWTPHGHIGAARRLRVRRRNDHRRRPLAGVGLLRERVMDDPEAYGERRPVPAAVPGEQVVRVSELQP